MQRGRRARRTKKSFTRQVGRLHPPVTSMHMRQQTRASWTSRQRSVAGLGALVILLAGAEFFQVRLAAPPAPSSSGAAKRVAAAVPDSFQHEFLPFLRRYCVDCHGEGSREGDFAFDRYRDLDAVKRDRHVW